MEYRGHQVFILHPDQQFRDKAVEFLRNEEYETFGFDITDPVALDNRREAVIFLHTENFDGGVCRELVSRIRNEGHDVHLVALGNGRIDECFTASVSGSAEEILEGMLDYLRRTGAQGHRHYVRFGSQNASIATFEYHEDGRRYAGIIHDISVRGISCTYRPEPDEPGPRRIHEMHLNLPGHRCAIGGRMTGQRRVAGQIIHVFMFDAETPQDILDDLHEFIYASLSMKLSVQ